LSKKWLIAAAEARAWSTRLQTKVSKI
jgi:hypothetical protein